MKTLSHDFDYNIDSLEKDFHELAPLFDDIVLNSKLGAAPVNLVHNIYYEASQQALSRKFERKMRRLLRVAVGIAAVLIVLGGVRINYLQQSSRRIEVINQLCIASNADLGSTLPPESLDANLAELLMELQGFDEESYFQVN